MGLEIWLSLLAFGAGSVCLLCHDAVPGSVRRELEAQRELAEAIVAGLGHGGGRVRLVDAAAADAALAPLAALSGEPARFAGVDEKRTQLRLAIDDLRRRAGDPPSELSLPRHAPFGRIEVDPAACTLCLACVSVCPAGAVLAAGDRPRLDFVEQNCVQCGLCATACPEDAITLVARLLLDPDQRAARRVLNEDRPFECVACGKPFATARTIERMLDKLAGHWMYRERPEQIERLKMCEDCRVKDMFRDGGGLLDVHGRE